MHVESNTNRNAFGSRALTLREMNIIRLITDGFKNKEIADQIGTTKHVVKNYLRSIYDKLGLDNRVQLALWYVSRENTKE